MNEAYSRMMMENNKFYVDEIKSLKKLLWAILRKTGPVEITDISLMMQDKDCICVAVEDRFRRSIIYRAVMKGRS